MSWADNYVAALQRGETIQFRPRGNSMTGKIDSGQLVTVAPATHPLSVGAIVLCRVAGNQYLHLITAIDPDGRYQISNNKGHINGWCKPEAVYGSVLKVED